MEEPPKPEKEKSAEEIEVELEHMLDEWKRLVEEYEDLYGPIERGSELDDWDYAVVEEARVGMDRHIQRVRDNLRNLLDFYKGEIERRRGGL